MPDDLIPGTLNVAFGVPICVEATITMTKIDVEPLTLVLMIGSAIIGFRNRRQDYFQNGYYEDPGCYGCCSYHRSRYYTM